MQGVHGESACHPEGTVVPWATELVAEIIDAHSERYQAVAILGAGLGVRQGEAFGLALDDVDWLRKVVHIRRQVKIVSNTAVFGAPKGDKVRDIPLPESVAMALAGHLEQHPARAVSLPWQSPDGDPVTVDLLSTTADGWTDPPVDVQRVDLAPCRRRRGLGAVASDRVPSASPLLRQRAPRRWRQRPSAG